jgi:hypothetical protein
VIGRLVLAAALSSLAAAALFARVKVPGAYGGAARAGCVARKHVRLAMKERAQ